METEVAFGHGAAPEPGDFEEALRAAYPHLGNSGLSQDVLLMLDLVPTEGEPPPPLWWYVWKRPPWKKCAEVRYEFMPAPWQGTTDPGNLDSTGYIKIF